MAVVEKMGASMQERMGSEEDKPVSSLEKILGMGGGEGQSSYAKNSQQQAVAVSSLLIEHCSDALEHISLPSDGTVVVADLGCATGSNTLNNVSFVIEKLRSRLSGQRPEFQAFFNDLPSNDFNNLFQHFSADHKDFFAAGVPGSFYRRLFPRHSVHVFLSSASLHWLSKIPEAVLNRDDPACNKGRFWTTRSSLAAQAAFKAQALKDLVTFLKVRAEELVRGGLLFVVASSQAPTGLDTSVFKPIMESYLEYVEEAFSQLTSEGVISEEQMDTLNLPVYSRNLEDIRQAVDICASDFRVHSITIPVKKTRLVNLCKTKDPVELSKVIVGSVRSVLTNIVETHLGKEISELFWQRYEKVINEKMIPEILARHESDLTHSQNAFVMALIRK